MNHRIGFSKRHSNGQITFLMAGIIAVLLGAVAMCSDVAVMYVNRLRLQTAIDSAAIAGANFLSGIAFANTDAACTGQPDEAKKAACTYAVRNGIAASSLTLTEPTTTTIKVTATRNSLPFYFGRAVGIRTYNIAGTSTAQADLSVGKVNEGLFPVGLQCTAPCNLSHMDPGQSVTFGQKFVGGLAPGNWQWMALGGTGNNQLGLDIQNGATGSFSIGDPVSSQPGNSGSSQNARSGMSSRLATCAAISDPCSVSGGNPHNIPVGDPCLVIVPAVDFHGCTGSCDVTIEGFAMIYLESNTTSTSIQGCFVQAVAAKTVTSSNAPALGADMPASLIN